MEYRLGDTPHRRFACRDGLVVEVCAERREVDRHEVGDECAGLQPRCKEPDGRGGEQDAGQQKRADDRRKRQPRPAPAPPAGGAGLAAPRRRARTSGRGASRHASLIGPSGVAMPHSGQRCGVALSFPALLDSARREIRHRHRSARATPRQCEASVTSGAPPRMVWSAILSSKRTIRGAGARKARPLRRGVRGVIRADPLRRPSTWRQCLPPIYPTVSPAVSRLHSCPWRPLRIP